MGELPNGCWSTRITLLIYSIPLISSCAPGIRARAVQAPCQGLIEYVIDQRTLAAPTRTGDRRERSQRNAHVDIVQVVVPCTNDFQPLRCREAARVRQDSWSRPIRSGRAIPAAFGTWFATWRNASACADCWEWESPASRSDKARSVKLGAEPVGWAYLAPRLRRRAFRHPARNRKRSRSPQSPPDRAPPQSACCRDLAACASAANKRVLSRGCRPIVGSSNTYSTPHKPLPSWLASRMRCASPLDNVAAPRPSVR